MNTINVRGGELLKKKLLVVGALAAAALVFSGFDVSPAACLPTNYCYH